MEPTPKSTHKSQQNSSVQYSNDIGSVDQLTVENLATLKRAFELHDDKEVHIDNLNVVLHSLGVVPSGDELKKMKEDLLVHANSNGTINFQKVLGAIGVYFLEDRYLNDGFTLPETQVLDAFKLFDKQGNGIIDVSLLRPYLLTLGKLTESEVDEMLTVADPQNTGKIRYYAFVKTLFQ